MGPYGSSGRGHDVRYHVVDADVFASGEGAESDLDLRHVVRVWIVFGVLAEFLQWSQFVEKQCVAV